MSRHRRIGDHRCVTHLYHIPMWIFDCVLGFHTKVQRSKGAKAKRMKVLRKIFCFEQMGLCMNVCVTCYWDIYVLHIASGQCKGLRFYKGIIAFL